MLPTLFKDTSDLTKSTTLGLSWLVLNPLLVAIRCSSFSRKNAHPGIPALCFLITIITAQLGIPLSFLGKTNGKLGYLSEISLVKSLTYKEPTNSSYDEILPCKTIQFIVSFP